MNIHATRKWNEGFTLIEVMIAMAIFTIIVTIGIGAVLNAISEAHSSENSRSVMDSLNFIMEDMARNIRLGSNFRCITDPSEEETYTTDTQPVTGQNCTDALYPSDRAYEIMFNDSTGQHVTYSFWNVGGTGKGPIKKRKGDAYTLEDITPSDVNMNLAQSGFTVRGAKAGDNAQPTIVIRLSGTIDYKGNPSNFSIETTVTPRQLDS